MLNFRTPLLVSFEYTQNISNIMDIILYIKNYNIQTTSITHLIPILYLNKIKSKFISIDIDFYELANKSYKLISKYRKYGVGQIRLFVEGPFVLDDILEEIKKIKSSFLGSIILVYKENFSNIEIKNFRNFVKKVESLNVIFSFMPIIDGQNKDLEKFLQTKKEEIINENFFLDEPNLYKKITGNNVICPNNFGLFIDYYGNVRLCKYSQKIIGNIQKKSLEDLYKKSQNEINLIKDKSCFLYGKKQLNSYQFLSKFYDEIMGNSSILYEKYLDFFEKLKIDKNVEILDLGAGTGNFLKLLKGKGYKNVFGIEKCNEMAKIANKKFSKKIVKLGDITKDLEGEYDVITSTFDSLNYITDKNLFKKVLGKISQNLNKGGYFICDINTFKKFKNHFKKIETYEINKNWSLDYISSYRKPFWKIKMNFINEKEKIIFSEIHFEIFYSKSEFFRMLKENKFKIIEWTENKGRLFVVLRK